MKRWLTFAGFGLAFTLIGAPLWPGVALRNVGHLWLTSPSADDAPKPSLRVRPPERLAGNKADVQTHPITLAADSLPMRSGSSPAIPAGGGISGISSPLCLVPVNNGLPIEKEMFQSFRMTSKVVAVPGLDRAIIFPWNRGGVWTIDESGTFVPFGGAFPNHYGDEYASDTSNGDVVGVSSKLGVFRLKRGEKHFQRLFAADGKPFVRPFSAVYVARFGGTVISDNSGLYLLKSSGTAESMFWDASVAPGGPGRVFDLPELNLLLFTAYGHAYLRDDAGKIIVFDDSFNGIRAARVTADKQIFIQPTVNDNYTVPWPPRDPAKLPAHQATHTYESFDGIEVYVGEIVAIHGRKVSIMFPSHDEFPRPIEFPVGDILVKPADDGIYTLNAENNWDFVDRSGEMPTRTAPSAFRLPVENRALLINGSRGLHLLVSKKDERAADCLK